MNPLRSSMVWSGLRVNLACCITWPLLPAGAAVLWAELCTAPAAGTPWSALARSMWVTMWQRRSLDAACAVFVGQCVTTCSAHNVKERRGVTGGELGQCGRLRAAWAPLGAAQPWRPAPSWSGWASAWSWPRPPPPARRRCSPASPGRRPALLTPAQIKHSKSSSSPQTHHSPARPTASVCCSFVNGSSSCSAHDSHFEIGAF